MQKWEYTNQSFFVGDPEGELRAINQIGVDGWEAYAVSTGLATSNKSVATYYFKRPKDSDG